MPPGRCRRRPATCGRAPVPSGSRRGVTGLPGGELQHAGHQDDPAPTANGTAPATTGDPHLRPPPARCPAERRPCRARVQTTKYPRPRPAPVSRPSRVPPTAWRVAPTASARAIGSIHRHHHHDPHAEERCGGAGPALFPGSRIHAIESSSRRGHRQSRPSSTWTRPRRWFPRLLAAKQQPGDAEERLQGGPLGRHGSRASLQRSFQPFLYSSWRAAPDAGFVAAHRGSVEPLIHAPEAIQPARIGGIAVIDDAILQHERTHARPVHAYRSPRRSRRWPRTRRPAAAPSSRPSRGRRAGSCIRSLPGAAAPRRRKR